MQMSYLSSEKSPFRPKKTDVVANSGADSANGPLYDLQKVHQSAKFCVDSSQNSAYKPGHMDPISKRKPNLTIDPPSGPTKMDPVAKIVSDKVDPVAKIVSDKMDPVAKIFSDSTSNYSLILSPRTSPKSELPKTSTRMTTGAAGLIPANTKTNGAKTSSSFTNNGQGSGNSSHSDCLESSSAPLKPHTGGDVRWDAINMVSKGSPLNLGHFRLLKRLGYGDIGSVYLVQLRGTKAYFAMKVMDKASIASRNKLLRAQTEREILGLLDHPFLPTLYSHFETDKFYCLVMEFCSGGNLHSLRQKQPNKYFTEEAAR